MDNKISALVEATSLVLTDLFAVVTGIGGTPQTKKLQWSTIYNIILGRNPLHGVTSRPIGASNPLPTAITTTTFTLGATANPISYYYQGTKIDVATDKTCTLSAGAGLYWIYFDGATGNIAASKSYPGFGSASNVTIATVLWNGTDYGLVSDERHSHTRNKDWHQWAHDTIGCRYASGLTLTHNGGTGAAATFATTAGEIADEDIKYAIDASSAFPTANAGRLFWQESASAYAFDKTPSTVPFKRGANNRPVYVRSDTYAVVEMTSAVNKYINVFVYATTDLHTPISFVTETVSPTVAANNGYNNLSDARAVPFPNLAGLATRQEVKPIYRLIVRADGVLQAIDTAQDDYRTVSSLPFGAGTVATTASAVNFNPYGNISSANVQAAIQELDDEKVNKTDALAADLTAWFSNYCLDSRSADDRVDGFPVAEDSSGNIYIIVPSSLGYFSSLQVKKSTDLGKTWTDIGTINTALYTSLNVGAGGITKARLSPIIDIDSDGNIGVLFLSKKASYTVCNNLYFAFYDLGTGLWSITQVTAETTSGRDIDYFDMKCAADNTWHITFCSKYASSSTSAQLRYVTRSAGTSGSFASIENLDDANGQARCSRIVVDSNSKPIIVFIDGGDSNYIKKYTKASGSWVLHASTVASTMNGLGNPCIDSSNNVYIEDNNRNINKVDTSGTWTTIATDSLIGLNLLIDSSNNIFQIYTGGNSPLSTDGYYSFTYDCQVQKYNGSSWVASVQTIASNRFTKNCIFPTTWKAKAQPRMLVINQAGISSVVNIVG